MEEALEAAWRVGFSEAMDGLVLDEDGDGPLWRLTLYAPSGAGASARSSALVFAANHAVSDQLSFNRVLSEVLSVLAERRTGRPVAPRIPPPQIRQSHHDESQDRDESLQVIASSCSFDVGCALAGTHRSKLHYRIRGCVWILGFFRAPFRTGDSDGTSVSRVRDGARAPAPAAPHAMGVHDSGEAHRDHAGQIKVLKPG